MVQIWPCVKLILFRVTSEIAMLAKLEKLNIPEFLRKLASRGIDSRHLCPSYNETFRFTNGASTATHWNGTVTLINSTGVCGGRDACAKSAA